MSENETPAPGSGNGAATGPDQQPKMRIMAQFIRDLSFENPMIQKAKTGDVSPDVQVQVGLDARRGQNDGEYEVFTKFNVRSTNKNDGEALFLLELDYGGRFRIEGVAENQLHPFLLIECPRMLFPFVRRVISDVTRDGGFPPVNLEPVDWVALYRQQAKNMAQQQEQAQAAEQGSDS